MGNLKLNYNYKYEQTNNKLKSNTNHIQVEAPANSPDLNPIEILLFADLKQFIDEKMCSDLDEVRQAIYLYRKNLTPGKCALFISHLRQVYF